MDNSFTAVVSVMLISSKLEKNAKNSASLETTSVRNSVKFLNCNINLILDFYSEIKTKFCTRDLQDQLIQSFIFYRSLFSAERSRSLRRQLHKVVLQSRIADLRAIYIRWL